MNEIDLRRKIIENTLVPHTAFNEGFRRMTQCFKYANGSAEPICTAIIGEARTGKTRLMEEFRLLHPITRQSEGLHVPILYVKTPSKPTVKGLVELLLQAIGDPKFHIGTENNKTMRLFTLMQSTGTMMIMIDEFQHFYDKGLRAVMHHVADWLKIFVDDCRISLVVGGLTSCQAVLDQNEQLAGRFLSRVEMPRFDWNNIDHQAEFIAILEAFQEGSGVGGRVIYDDRKMIALNHLAEAHQESVWDIQKISGIPNPFSKSFKLSASPEILEKINLIGKAIPEVNPPKRRTRKSSQKSATQQIF